LRPAMFENTIDSPLGTIGFDEKGDVVGHWVNLGLCTIIFEQVNRCGQAADLGHFTVIERRIK